MNQTVWNLNDEFYRFALLPIDIYHDTYKVSAEMYEAIVKDFYPAPINVDPNLRGIEMRHECRR